MKKLLITSIQDNLNKGIVLLDTLDSTIYSDTSVGPYYSSIGSHMRHILDFFDCIISGLDTNTIDLTARKRDELISTNRDKAKERIRVLQAVLSSYEDTNSNYLLHVTDDMGHGKITVDYTLESILSHANNHTIHHYAVIGYILNHLGVSVSIKGFGYNPTTPIPTETKVNI